MLPGDACFEINLSYHYLMVSGVSKKYLTEPTTMGLASLLAPTENEVGIQTQTRAPNKSKKASKKVKK